MDEHGPEDPEGAEKTSSGDGEYGRLQWQLGRHVKKSKLGFIREAD